ncbi:ABC transporter permease [Sediminibacillus halophilus]|uniref:Transport permease protein n=1 Tax=Sediminibacillus halophilus TaxID=482461 RepID=A0A1G9NZW8_9BACI|nr:ABC transporter permease [Sediminibacillus halophilus]SDL91950.1 ABC-2 type transport system permease protein [Sediminibacillus halophilus]
MWAIAQMELKKNIHDKGIWFWTFILPILFIIVFVAVFSGQEGVEYAETVTQIIPGYTVMFTFFIMISILITFIKDRERGMVARIASTPISVSSYFLGKWIPFMIIVLLQIAVLFLFGVLVYDLPLGDPTALIVMSLFQAFLATSWGLAMAVLVKTENMGIALTQIIALGGALLGGLWMPIEIMPDIMQTICKFIPQYWGLEGYKEIILHDGGVLDIWQPLAILLVGGAIGVLIAITGYQRYLRLAKS